jgi:methyl-accepting chemotaxis protein
MGEITSATQEQTGGIEQVNQAIGQMDQVTQQNAALVEEAAAAAASMQEQAAKLAEVVGVFKVERGFSLATPVAAKPVARPALPRATAPASAPKRPVKRAEPVAAGDWEEF